LALHQHLQKLESSLTVQLRTRKNGFNTFLYQARVPTVPSPLCSCGRGSQTVKHIIIHCRNFSAARHALRDNQGRLPDYKQLVTTLTGLKKVTRWVIERGMLGQYQRARGLLYPPGPPSPAND
jgi:tubulin alpha